MIHKKLMKVRWYKAWHQKPYANLVHNLVVGAGLAVNLCLLFKLQELINQTY